MSSITKNPKRTITGLATVLAAAGVAIGSGASFTAQTANADNIFTAGSLQMANDRAPGAILRANNMKIGDVQTGTVQIKNTGTLSGNFRLSEEVLEASNNFGGDALRVSVQDVTAPAAPVTVVGNEPVGKVSTAATPFYGLGAVSPNAIRTYKFTVTLTSRGTDALDNLNQGKSISVKYVWDATQQAGQSSNSTSNTSTLPDDTTQPEPFADNSPLAP